MMDNNVGIIGATDLNDLIRGLEMVLAQAKDIRACGGTLTDVKSIGTCGTCGFNPIMCDYGRDITKCEGYPHICCECDDDFYEEDEFCNDNEGTTLDDLVQLLRENR